jgi:hypothetical protein
MISMMSGLSSIVEEPSIQVLFGVILLVAGSYWTYVMRKMDRNQTALWERMDKVCKQVDILQGEHNICVGKHHNKEDL